MHQAELDPMQKRMPENLLRGHLMAKVMAFGALAMSSGVAPAEAEERKIGVPETRLFDVGVGDFNGDGKMDVFSTAHSFESSLLIGKGNGEFTDMTDELGFGHLSGVPNFEDINKKPELTKPGLYAYMAQEKSKSKKTELVLVAHDTSVRGNINFDPARDIHDLDTKKGQAEVSTYNNGQNVDFSLEPGGTLEIDATLQIPAYLTTEGSETFIGPNAVPADNRVRLQLPDRHGVALGDLDGDGADDDVFIANGGLGGELTNNPSLIGIVHDTVLINNDGLYQEADLGLIKGDCRGRQTAIVDVNADGAPDIFTSCEEDNPIINIKTAAGWQMEEIPVPGQMYRFVQVGKSSTPRLAAFDDKRVTLWERTSSGWAQVGKDTLMGEAQHVTTGDVNGDGKIDMFISSSQGNSLILTNGVNMRVISPQKLGLPEKGSAAALVDQNSDGRVDLHQLQGGLYTQKSNGKFEETGKYTVDTLYGHVSWADFDGDGDQDPMAAKTDREFAETGNVSLLRAGQPSWLAVEGAPLTSRVEVDPAGKAKKMVSWIGAAETSRHSDTNHRANFSGLGSADKVHVTVTTPDGRKSSFLASLNQVVDLSQ